MSSQCGNPGSGRTILTFGPPVEGAVKVMMIICAVITLLLNAKPELVNTLALWVDSFLPWQVVTATFCHVGLMHLAFNLFALWIFGGQLENFWGTKKFVTFFLVTSTSANLLWFLWGWQFSAGGGLLTLGASGGVFAMLYAYAYFWPDNTLLAFWLFPVRAKVFVFIYGFLELFFAVTSSGGSINHIIHLSGLVVAAIWLDYTCDGRGFTWLRKKHADFTFKRKTRHLTVIKGSGSGEKNPNPSDENRPRIIN